MKPILTIIFAALPAFAYAAELQDACQQSLSAGKYAQAIEQGKAQNGYSARMCTGRAQQAMGEHAAAEQSFSSAADIANEISEKVIALIFLARASRDSGKSERAIASYRHVVELASSNKLNQAQIVALNESGRILLSSGDPKGALEQHSNAHALAANDNERSECNQLIASAYEGLGNLDKAFEFQLKSVLLEERSGEPDQHLKSKLGLARIAMLTKDYKRAAKELQDVLHVAKSGGSEYWESWGLLYQARLHKLLGDTNQATILLKQALELSRRINADNLSSQISTELALPQ